MAGPFDDIILGNGIQLAPTTPPSVFGTTSGYTSGFTGFGGGNQAPMAAEDFLASFASPAAQPLQGAPQPIVEPQLGAAPLMPQIPGGQIFQETPQAGPQILAWRGAMQDIESGGRYDLTVDAGRGRRVYGAYQVERNNIGPWTRRWFGRALTPEEFLRSPEAQDAVFDGQFQEYIRQFGSPQKAAEAWMSPVAAAGGSVGPDRFGTSAAAHGRNFMSALSRRGVTQQPGFRPETMGMSPEMALATGSAATTVPAPTAISSRAAAMAPALAAGQAAAAQPAPAPVAGPTSINIQDRQPSWTGQLINTLMGGDATRPQIAGGYIDALRGAPTGSELNVRQHQAASAIIQRGQELRADNPGASATQIAQLLLRDPVFGQNALHVGPKAMAILQQAVSDPGLPALQRAGDSLVSQDPSTGAIQERFTAQPDLARTFQWYTQQTPEVQGQVRQYLEMQRRSQSQPSDKEQAIERIKAAEASGQQPDVHDLQIAGYIREEPVLDEFNRITGYQTVNRYQRARSGQVPGVAGSVSPSVAPGGTATAGAPAVPPPAAGAPASPSQAQTRRYRRNDGTEYNVTDLPGLSLQSSLTDDPSTITGSAGPVGAATSLLGGLIGNVPGFEDTAEMTHRRESLIQNMRSAYTSYREGRRLAGEHQESMLEVPEARAWLTNPVQNLTRLISLRESVVKQLELYRDQLKRPVQGGFATETRKNISDNLARGEAFLLTMPTIAEMIETRNGVLEGRIDVRPPNETVGALIDRATGAAKNVVGEVTGNTATPTTNYADMSDDRLRDLYFRNGTTPEQKAAITAEAVRRNRARPRQSK